MKVPVKIALIYVGVCSIYILFSDAIVLRLFASSMAITAIQSYKGTAFVFASGGLIYWLVARYFEKLSQSNLRLKDTIDHYQMIFDKNPLPAFIIDQKTLRYVHVNEAALLKFRRTRKEYFKATVGDFFVGLDKDDLLRYSEQIKDSGYMELTLDAVDNRGIIINQHIFCQKIIFRGRPAILCIGMDITSTKNPEQLIVDKMIDALEKERQNIAREIHDSIKQYFGIIHGLIRSIPTSKNADKLLARAEETAEKGIQESRRLSHSITPNIDAFDLVTSVEYMIENLNYLSKIQFRLEANITNLYKDETELNLYRIIQEATTNIRVHSGAKHGYIKLFEDDEFVILEISDDGVGLKKGFSSKSLRSLGLTTIRTRATKLHGYFTLQSGKKEGTVLRVKAPIAANLRNIEPERHTSSLDN